MKVPSSKRKKRFKVNRVFTILELLVVIAIITILAGVLLPTLKKAKDRTQQIQCAARLKQCGILFCNYSIDFDNYMVPNYNPALLAASNAWDRILKNADYISNNKILFCPIWNPAPEYVSATGYGMKGYDSFLKHSKALNDAPSGTSPSSFMLLADTVNHLGTQTCYICSIGYSSTNYRIHLRHLQKANLLCLDGHTVLIGLNELRQRKYYPYPYRAVLEKNLDVILNL
ncbi:MAG: hypothetical protein A2017_03315 [Lentisphaerae bacterium GWF2_44_16]|nr:MAG: hypothetical protein A2017_03315 [Lentisphaerae bacterium GWF2_44_16]